VALILSLQLIIILLGYMHQVLSDAHEHGAAVLGVPMKATVKVGLYAFSAICCLKNILL
jgi:hypothetical protein